MSSFSTKDYYVQAFNKLETQNKDTWNWAAFFFPGAWMLFRKMYLYFFAAVTFNIFALLSLSFVQSLLNLDPNSFLGYSLPIPSLQTPVSVLYIILFLVYSLTFSLIFGKYANRIYYRIVKKRIQQGYHLLEHFRPTSYSAVIFIHLIPISSYLVPMLYGIADYINKRSLILPTSEEAFEVNESNIRNYLTRSKKDAFANNVAKFILLFLSLSVFIYQISKTVSKIQNETQKDIQNIVQSIESDTSTDNKKP